VPGSAASIAVSGDGLKVWAAMPSPGGVPTGIAAGIFASTDTGTSWTPTGAPTANWTSITASTDGTTLLAGESGGGIYRSTDAGATWTAMAAPQSGVSWLLPMAGSGNLQKAFAFASWDFSGLGLGYLYSLSNSTTVGTTGSITGTQYDAISLQYIGANTFIVLDASGNLLVQ
jgi:hypothetical protein